MLYTSLPSERYAPQGRSIQVLMRAVAQDLNAAAEEGVEVRGQNNSVTNGYPSPKIGFNSSTLRGPV